ncbi:MAG: hypothetical protein ACXW0Q_10065 [Methylovulum sp.]
MKRTHSIKKRLNLSYKDISKEIAIHEAGHAAAIYLGNKQKGLPPVFFQIFIQSFDNDFESAGFLDKNYDNHIAKIEGGRLIDMLPSSFEQATKDFSTVQKLAYERAFEADIVNLLVGPLAEAKYVAMRDDELVNHRLVTLDSLHYYGGLSDLKIVSDYLECYIASNELRERKITALFQEAFNFVSNKSNWLAILGLTDYILADDKDIIECEEIISVLESNTRRAAALCRIV